MQDDGDADVEPEVIDEDVGEDAGFEPELPEPPAPPVLTPCPEGWREGLPEEAGGVITCDPWPEGGQEDCAEDEAHFPGEPECATIGTPCGTGEWADDLPSEADILYVRHGAPSGGTGGPDSPFGTINEAVGAAHNGTVVALSRGVFEEEVLLPSGVTLWGACVAGTTVTSAEPSTSRGTITVRGVDAAVRNLRVTGNRRGIWVVGAAVAHMEGVLIESARTVGFQIDPNATATATSIVVRNTQADEAGAFGRGIFIMQSGSATINRSVFIGNRDAAVVASGSDAELLLQDCAVLDTHPQDSNGMFGFGINPKNGAKIEAHRVIVDGSAQAGIIVHDVDTSLILTDSVVRNTQGIAESGGRGLVVQQQGSARVEHTTFHANREAAVFVGDSGSSLAASDIVVRGTLSTDDDLFGGGLSVQNGAQADITRALVERNHEFGVWADGEGTVLHLADTIVRGTESSRGGSTGRGLNIQGVSDVEVHRAVIEDNQDIGIFISGSTASATMDDIVVRGTGSQESSGLFGRGIEVQEGAHVTLTRAVIEGNRDAGILAASEKTVVELTDVSISETMGREADGRFGRGMAVYWGAIVTGTRLSIERNRDVGILAACNGTDITLIDVSISHTIEADCAADLCSEAAGGTGVAAIGGAHIDLRSFVVYENVLCGVQLAHGHDPGTGEPFPTGGTMDLHDGKISRNTIGINVQTESFDLNRLQDNVIVEGNERNLDMNELPVPEMGL